MRVLHAMEMVAAIMLIAAMMSLLGYKAVEHVAGMMTPHAQALEAVAK